MEGEKQEEVTKVDPKDLIRTEDDISFVLRDGRSCKVIVGKGAHSVKAQREIDPLNKDESFKVALQAALTFIDNKPISKEELLSLPMKDYHRILEYWAELNF